MISAIVQSCMQFEQINAPFERSSVALNNNLGLRFCRNAKWKNQLAPYSAVPSAQVWSVLRVIPYLSLPSCHTYHITIKTLIYTHKYICITSLKLRYLVSEIKPAPVWTRQSSGYFFLHEKRHCAGSCSNFNLSLWKKCASNYLKCKINKSQTCVTFSPIIINKGHILRERLKQKHSALLLSDEIKLSLERLPKSCTLTGKIKTILSSECHVTFNYNLTDGSLISRCPFQGWRRRVKTPSSVSLGQVLTWFSKSTTKQKD